MDFAFTEEQELLRRSLRELLARVCPPEYARACDEAKEPPREARRALDEGGWVGLAIPEEYGGQGRDALDLAILLEEGGRAYLDLGTWLFRDVCYGGEAILRDGTEEQKRFFLPRVARGELSFSFALTEPEAGSDAAAIVTRARREGEGYRITGRKPFTSGMNVCHYILVAARTSREERKHKGITNFLLPRDRPGMESRPLRTLGHRAMGTHSLFLDEVPAGPGDVLGEVGEGWRGLTYYLSFERLCLSAARTGAAGAALEEALAYAKVRQQFGKPIGSFQAVSHKLAEMHVLVDTARLLVYRFAWEVARGKPSRADAASLKLFASEAYKQVADLGLQVLGGYGYIADHSLERHYRDARLATIGAGTSEIQKNIIARELGLG